MVNQATAAKETKESNPCHVVTGRARLSFCFLCRKRATRKADDTAKYSGTFLVPKSDVTTKRRIDEAIEAAKEKGKTSKWGRMPAVVPIPVYDGDGVRPNGEKFGPECKGHWVFTANNETKPRVVDVDLQEILDETEIYSGMYVRASVDFFPYANSGRNGVGCSLQNVQKLGDGEPLTSRVSVEDDFGGSTGGYDNSYLN